jgi:hypothetical protein
MFHRFPLKEISGFHGSEYDDDDDDDDDDSFLGYGVAKSGRSIPTFQRCEMPPY